MIEKVATSEVFRRFLAILSREIGTQVDAYERYDGDPAGAIAEHIAVISGPTRNSILVGFTVKEAGQRDAAGWKMSDQVPISIIAVRRRGGADQVTADCEALDDLADLIEEVVSPHNERVGVRDLGCQSILFDSTTALVGGDDWFGRSVNVIAAKLTIV